MNDAELEIIAARMGDSNELEAERFVTFLNQKGYDTEVTDDQHFVISIDGEPIEEWQFFPLLEECFKS